MNVADYIVNFLEVQGVTDAFGIPGGVILDLLYAFSKSEKITPHLNYHEQMAGFAAEGYAQKSRRLGVAYATRGPGVSNLITPLADAYFDSIPVLFITAHSNADICQGEMRIIEDQEWDASATLSSITKYSARIDQVEDVKEALVNACGIALSGRQGPVFLDFNSRLFHEDIQYISVAEETYSTEILLQDEEAEQITNEIIGRISISSRPVILIGDGVKQSKTEKLVRALAEDNNIPVLSSRFSEDIMNDSEMYFGYIGSHGIRYSNFILAKSDLIISIGNRLSFPVNSKSYSPVLSNSNIIRIEIDKGELKKEIPGIISYCADIRRILPLLRRRKLTYSKPQKWLSICNMLKENLSDYDLNNPTRQIGMILKKLSDNTSVVSDVGNHEFWLSRAYILSHKKNPILYSKSFGSLGCGLGKSIGAYCSSSHPVACFIGDQGFQLNIQELQYITDNRIPVAILVVNNHSSGMIRQRELSRYGYPVHTTKDSGYGCPPIQKIAETYRLPYLTLEQFIESTDDLAYPCIVELDVDEDDILEPSIPVGNPIQQMFPDIPQKLYQKLEQL